MTTPIDARAAELFEKIRSDLCGNYRSEADTAIFLTESLGWRADRALAYLQSHRAIRNEKGIYGFAWEGMYFLKIDMIDTFVLREIRRQSVIRRHAKSLIKNLGEI